jgi:hypothetical protein
MLTSAVPARRNRLRNNRNATAEPSTTVSTVRITSWSATRRPSRWSLDGLREMKVRGASPNDV